MLNSRQRSERGIEGESHEIQGNHGKEQYDVAAIAKMDLEI